MDMNGEIQEDHFVGEWAFNKFLSLMIFVI